MCPDARRTKRRRTKRYEKTASLPKKTATGRRSTSKRKKSPTVRTLLGGWVLKPYLAFLLLLGVGVATFRLEHQLRLTLLWLMLLGIVLLYAESGRLKADYSLLNLTRGALVGIIVALPFYLFAKDFFYATASRLYGVDDLQVLLERAIFLVPILEESFFRGVVQRERGLPDGALLFGLAQGLYFISAVDTFPVVIAAVALGSGLLGLLYGYLYQRYGLTASTACHVAVNLVLFVLPPLVDKVSELLLF
jgi:membrane protease YdiL (CAAX protease family)